MTTFLNFRVLKSFVLTAATGLLVAACSGGGGGGSGVAPAVPLTPEQTARLDLTAENVADVSNWETAPNRSAGSTSFEPAMAAERASKAAKADIQKTIFDPAACAVKVVQPPVKVPTMDPNQPVDMNSEMGVSIAGGNCPIAFSWAQKTTQKMDAQSMSMTGDFSIDYAGRAARAQAFDVDSYQLAMGFTMNVNKDGGNGVVTGSGQITSRSQGKIVIGISGGMQFAQESSTSTVVVRMSYPDGLVVEFKEAMTNNPKTGKTDNAYFINNSAVSEKVFKRYQKSFGMDKGAGTSADSRTGSGRIFN